MKRVNLHPPTIIFSVSRHDRTLYDNNLRSEVLRGLLREFGVRFKDVKGKYNGQLEDSFVVMAKHEKLIHELAAVAGQDSYLYLDEYRNAYLTMVNDSENGFEYPARERLGQFVLSRTPPEGNYTRDGANYYEVI